MPVIVGRIIRKLVEGLLVGLRRWLRRCGQALRGAPKDDILVRLIVRPSLAAHPPQCPPTPPLTLWGAAFGGAALGLVAAHAVGEGVGGGCDC